MRVKEDAPTLYWIGTPRHFIIAAGMALEHARESESHLLLTSRQSYVDGMASVLKEWRQSPFSRVDIVQESLKESWIASRLQTMKSISRFRRLARKCRFSRVRVFPATTHESQAFLYETGRRFPDTERSAIEDGGIYYNKQSIGGHVGTNGYGMVKLLAGRTLYGPAWKAALLDGIGAVIDSVHLVSPELVRHEFRSNNLVKLSPDHLLRLADTDLPFIYMRTVGANLEQFKGIELIVILSRTDGIGREIDSYVKTVNCLVDAARKHGLKTAIKYHPKESFNDYMGLADMPGIVEIPRHLPAELLFIINVDSLQLVLGDASTALLGAPWLLPNCQAASFVNMTDKRSELIPEDLSDFGIEKIGCLQDFEEILSRLDHSSDMCGGPRVNPQWPSENMESLVKSIKLIAFDFDGVFTDNTVLVFDDGREAVCCNRSDGIGLRVLDGLGIESIVISTETNAVVSQRCEKLGIRCFQGVVDKLETLTTIAEQVSVALSEVAFVGNDINDLDCLKAVALPIAVGDSHADVLPHALYRTAAFGGAGAVREVCDLFEHYCAL